VLARWPLFASDHIRISGGDPLRIALESAPALGDVRAAGKGTTLYLVHGLTKRRDYGRYSDAIRQAIDNGANVRWIR
jgi:hypothetical protein